MTFIVLREFVELLSVSACFLATMCLIDRCASSVTITSLGRQTNWAAVNLATK